MSESYLIWFRVIADSRNLPLNINVRSSRQEFYGPNRIRYVLHGFGYFWVDDTPVLHVVNMPIMNSLEKIELFVSGVGCPSLNDVLRIFV